MREIKRGSGWEEKKRTLDAHGHWPDCPYCETPFISAPVSDEAKLAAVTLCKADEPEVPKNFEIWHLDKINKYTLTLKDN